MYNKSIRFAFAVNKVNAFEPKNFGKADRFLIYEWINNEFKLLRVEANPFKNMDEELTDGSSRKGHAIIDLLKSFNVNVLVSIKFGKNIQMVNRSFIPVLIISETPDEATNILKKHIKWIQDELKNKPEEFKLFTIKNGILKTVIKQDISTLPALN